MVQCCHMLYLIAKKTSYSFTFLVILFLFFLFSTDANAYDYSISCTNKTCTNFPSNAFFTSTTNWFPGMWEKKVVRISNSSAKEGILVKNSLVSFVPDTSSCNIDHRYLLSISIQGQSPPNNISWAGSLQDLYGLSSSPPYIAYILPKSYVEATYLVSLSENIGNECQGKKTDFALNLIFTSDTYTPPKNTLTPTLGPNSLPPCSQVAPLSAPVLSLSNVLPDRATLNFTKPTDSFTYFLLAYGTKSGEYIYGNPNVGDPETSEYTVIGLSSNSKYYFAMRAVNGCAPGPFSNEVSLLVPTKIPTITPTGSVLGATVGPRTPTPTRTRTPTPTPTLAVPGSPLYNYLYIPVIIAIFIIVALAV